MCSSSVPANTNINQLDTTSLSKGKTETSCRDEGVIPCYFSYEEVWAGGQEAETGTLIIILKCVHYKPDIYWHCCTKSFNAHLSRGKNMSATTLLNIKEHSPFSESYIRLRQIWNNSNNLVETIPVSIHESLWFWLAILFVFEFCFCFIYCPQITDQFIPLFWVSCSFFFSFDLTFL